MPGKIIAVAVKAGDAVTKGQKLLTLEAMKMEHSLAAPFDGIVAELNAERGRAGERRRPAGADREGGRVMNLIVIPDGKGRAISRTKKVHAALSTMTTPGLLAGATA